MAFHARPHPGRPGKGEVREKSVKRSVRLPESLDLKAEAYRRIKNWSFADIVCEALAEYLERHPAPGTTEDRTETSGTP